MCLDRRCVIGFVFVLAGTLGAQSAAKHTLAARLEQCDLVPNRTSFCGFYEVPENRSLEDGRRIGLHIVVVKARTDPAEPDPVVFLAGGPGDAATRHTSQLLADFPKLLSGRDLILIDQRGTGESNPLDCGRDPVLAPLFYTGAAPAGALEACAARLHADPRFYTTAEAADDIAAAVTALGYSKVNLYGVSYGTRLGQMVALRHPDLVRSLVLQLVLPTDTALFVTQAQDGQAALARWFAECEADQRCRGAYPDLRRDFKRVREAASREQRVVQLQSGERIELSPASLALALNAALYQSRFATGIPLALHRAATGDYELLLSHLLLARLSAPDHSIGLYLSIICSEDVERMNHLDLDRETRNTYGGSVLARALRQTCSRWPCAPAQLTPTRPVRVPTLMLSGAVDPVAGPARAERARKLFPESVHIVVPFMAHGPIDECLKDEFAAFISEPRPKQFISRCPLPRRPDFQVETVAIPNAVSDRGSAVSVAGTWEMTFTNAKTRGASELRLEQDGEKLTGTLRNTAGGDMKVSGTIKGNAVSLIAHRLVQVNIEAVVEGESMSGTFKVLAKILNWKATRKSVPKSAQ